MKPNFTLTSLCLITVSLSEFVIKEVQHGGEASLLCSNLSTSIINISWFKMDKRANTKPRSSNRQIASMSTADSNATVQEEFKNGRFHMSANTTHVFLNITKVDLSDSGMYFCGLYKKSTLSFLMLHCWKLKVRNYFISNFHINNLNSFFSFLLCLGKAGRELSLRELKQRLSLGGFYELTHGNMITK
uniref:Ig-like domain-containing protein n=1 Tax=Oryzias latipes TaxID=8090 RepID=A0A3B3I9C0_ORYLA